MRLLTHRGSFTLALLLIALFNCLVSHATEPSDIASVLQPFVDRHELAGAVMLVASKDKVLSLEAVGYADIATKKRMSTDALFWIASMSKPITSTALMMLVDEGKVQLDDPLRKVPAPVHSPDHDDECRWDSCSIREASASDHRAQSAEPHEWHSCRIRSRNPNARRVSARDPGAELRTRTAAVRAGQRLFIFECRHQTPPPELLRW
jgi:hypothetical protein